MYGVEYKQPIGGTINDDATCAVCYVAICGTMQCPPYVNYKELTCAVCTK